MYTKTNISETNHTFYLNILIISQNKRSKRKNDRKPFSARLEWKK